MIITIPGKPHAQGRPRFTVRHGYVIAYDPPASKQWKNMARELFASHNPELLLGPVHLSVYALFRRPVADNHSPECLQWHTKRPDLDNIVKAIKDAGTGVLWKDDSQVCQERLVKLTLPRGLDPFVRIVVLPLENDSWLLDNYLEDIILYPEKEEKP